MKIDQFEMERMQSTWENIVEMDMSESGVRPVMLRELMEMGLDLEAMLNMPLGYSQSNGTIALRDSLALHYPGATPDHIEVTNGTSEANYLLALALLSPGDEVALQVPNYMQFGGVPPSLGAKVNRFRLRIDQDWEPDWEEFDRAVNQRTRLLYLSNPNNPSGSVLSEDAMQRMVARCQATGTYLLADEVYLGAEIHCPRTRSFWGMSDRVIVTSGLSKAYGIPGVRIGWMVGPRDVVAACWSQHDYITIGPNKLSDAVAQVAVKAANRERLYARTRAILQHNLPIMREWAASFGEFLTFREPQAGALCLMRYHSTTPSYELCERIRIQQSVLIVPGVHLGLEGFIRVWLGGKPEFLTEGLRRIGQELRIERELRKESACG
ncbi:MAG TPA: aminotransferase class I/II-fold pyridoxal phosphate-dependent enzyme [Candidatus Acidoferrales bacterium]|nr:aminotransferase class I/II-fold pyridoxal phosphate-dependent enzyme [Candidatus Acidoferrales bacterium]